MMPLSHGNKRQNSNSLVVVCTWSVRRITLIIERTNSQNRIILLDIRDLSNLVDNAIEAT